MAGDETLDAGAGSSQRFRPGRNRPRAVVPSDSARRAIPADTARAISADTNPGPTRDATASTAPLARSQSTFEEAFAAAERAVDLLERGDLALEDALRRYEEGLLAIRCCREILEGAQRRIEVLGRDVGCVVEGDDGPVWKPAASFPQLEEALDALERGEGFPHSASPGPSPGSNPGGPREEDGDGR